MSGDPGARGRLLRHAGSVFRCFNRFFFSKDGRAVTPLITNITKTFSAEAELR